ncbi:uncharacterized protein CG1161 isoform X1 [Diorhabda sublineata]|uniref:uncharacterized protein CG1161 isoform X1 n=1 Tax=Diorhabda sublineata TaxID=1163346 RepID=UPI0024E08C96|nr:uncharacterized protein CG1161 isoform X1 [Diorhabda sublineata]
MQYYLLILSLSSIFAFSTAQSYDDKRCKCICPSISSVTNKTESKNHTSRILYITNVPPNKCNCDGVILPRIGQDIVGKEQEFCPRCDCKYENRNTTIIKVVVIIVIWVISILVIYMAFLIILDPLLNKRIKGNYQEHTNEEEIPFLEKHNNCLDSSAPNIKDEVAAGSMSHNMSVRGNVLNRVGHQQDKWKRQVKEQRKNIYDRHTMLN